MTQKYNPIDTSKLTTYSIKDRKSKVSDSDFGSVWEKGGSFASFLDSLPSILAADDLRAVVSETAKAFANKKTVMFGMGAHVIKTGLNPVIIDLMENGVISSLSMNGAGIIHDTEVAMTGATSEDVAASLGDGTFGMAKETGEFLSDAIQLAAKHDTGLGEAVGRHINDSGLPFAEKSLIASAQRLGKPVTIHVAFGTDIIHMHPGFDPAAAGAASHKDFLLFASIVSTLEQGVYFNAGSAVILPEVFLKAMTLVRNLGHNVDTFTAVNLDFIRHYRPMTNVVNRPTAKSGKGYSIVGHHEILLPLIAAGIKELI